MKTAARVLVAGIVVAAGVSGCSSSSTSSTSAPASGAVVEVAHMAFTPNTITVAAGETVTWKFDDRGTPHDVVGVGDAKSVLHSAPMKEGTFSFTFTQPGTYQYLCTFHPDMRGTVVVR
ncbi:cupredoxin domain-containing protein [Rhodococcus sp. NPDC059234]|uniref:cupredoxin domain-containing protein n=1 Tax=Rhodococcus sp. NPDC059234 TaxID=3346781 RepID=UPI0036709B9D